MAASIHLDTNFLIYYVGGGNEGIIQQVEQWILEGNAICVSAMAWAEFLCGPLPAEEQVIAEDLLHEIFPISAAVAVTAGKLFRETGRRSRSLPDCLIAATAILERSPLATNNRDDFEIFLPLGLQLC
jgi:predicted nucleic acid-binding protein